MIKEIYSKQVIETTLNVTQSEIDSIRKKDITKTACRVYENGFVGISGVLGDATETTWKEAEENLKLQIPYKYAPETNKTRKEDKIKEKLSSEEFLEKAEAFLAKLHKEFPNFIFGNKIAASEEITKLTNDNGLEYENKDMIYYIAFTFKHINSTAVFDGGIGFDGREADFDKHFNDIRDIFKAFENNVELPNDEILPVVVGFYEVGGKIMEGLDGREIGKKASIFSNKLGEKVFNDNFTLFADRSNERELTTFFDMEGSTLKNDKCALIEKGVIARGFTDKKNADEFGYENTADRKSVV